MTPAINVIIPKTITATRSEIGEEKLKIAREKTEVSQTCTHAS